MAGFLDGALLDSGDSARHRDDYARLGQAAASVHFLDEIAQHALGDVEVGDYPVFQRPDRDDIAGRTAYHALGLQADRDYLPGIGIKRDYRWFVQNNPAPPDIHQGVGGTQVDCHVTAEKGQRVAHLLPYGQRVRRTRTYSGKYGLCIWSTPDRRILPTSAQRGVSGDPQRMSLPGNLGPFFTGPGK